MGVGASPPVTLDRRRFLAGLLAGAAGAAATACGASGSSNADSAAPSSASSTPGSSATPSSSAAAASSTSRPGASSTSTTNEPTTTAGKESTTTSSAPGGPAPFVVHGPSQPDRVALTFHTNGDLALAEKLLKTVESRQVPITTFIIGSWLDANPKMAKRIMDGGHELANHTYTHPTFSSLSRAQVVTEITKCRDTLARLSGGQGGRWFRPSGFDDGTESPSAMVLEEAGKAGYQAVLGFDVDPLDYRDPGRDAVVSRTLATVKPGSIVSLHFGHQGTVDALPAILDGLADKRLQPVTLSTLLG